MFLSFFTGIDANKFAKFSRLGIPIPFICHLCHSLDIQQPTELHAEELIDGLIFRPDNTTATDESTFW